MHRSPQKLPKEPQHLRAVLARPAHLCKVRNLTFSPEKAAAETKLIAQSVQTHREMVAVTVFADFKPRRLFLCEVFPPPHSPSQNIHCLGLYSLKIKDFPGAKEEALTIKAGAFRPRVDWLLTGLQLLPLTL